MVTLSSLSYSLFLRLSETLAKKKCGVQGNHTINSENNNNSLNNQSYKSYVELKYSVS